MSTTPRAVCFRWFFLVLALAAGPGASLRVAEQPLDVKQVLDEMARQRGQFDAKGLHGRGAAGLTALLDYLMPETTPAPKEKDAEKTVRALIEQLGDDDFQVREQATARLVVVGRLHRPLVEKEAGAWREWLLRAVAGTPSQVKIMYGLAGERRLTELELPWIPGYEGSRPVRVGNAAHDQFQLDVFGEVMDALHLARRSGLQASEGAWHLQRAMLDYLGSAWHEPDEGIWEVRGPRRHFTHSKVMAWVAVDRMIKSAERYGLHGPVEHWRRLRDAIHAEVCERGYDAARNTFVQYYGAKELDASLLMIPLVGFLQAFSHVGLINTACNLAHRVGPAVHREHS